MSFSKSRGVKMDEKFERLIKKFEKKFYTGDLLFLANIRNICGDGMKNLTQLYIEINKKGTISSSSISSFIKNLESYGLIETRRIGRCRYVSLTDIGKEIADHILKIRKILRNTARV